MDAHHIEPMLRDGLRETLDAEQGPHPVWAGSPAARRVAEGQQRRWPLRAIAAAAAVMVVAVVGYPFLAGGSGPGGATLRPGLAANGLIALAKDGDILVADRPGGDLRPLVAGPEHDEQPTFSPDGTKLAFVREIATGRALMVADADGTNVVQVAPESSDPSVSVDVGAWSFAPDSLSLMAVVAFNGEKRLVVRPLDPGAALTILDVRLPGGWMDIVDPSFRPTNPQEVLVWAELEPAGPRGLYVYDRATSGIRTIVEPAEGSFVDSAAWSPNGEQISYDLWDGTARRARVVAADGSQDRVLDDAPDTTNDDRVSPWSNDGMRTVLSRGRDGEDGQWVVGTGGDGEPVELACGPTTDIGGCAPSWIWSPDDSMLIGTSITGETTSTATYQLADPNTGQVTELDWDDAGVPSWQRIAP